MKAPHRTQQESTSHIIISSLLRVGLRRHHRAYKISKTTMTSKSTPKVSRGLRVARKTQSPTSGDVKAERAALMDEIAQIERWWRESRWKGTTRTFSGELYLSTLSVIARPPNLFYDMYYRTNSYISPPAWRLVGTRLTFVAILHIIAPTQKTAKKQPPTWPPSVPRRRRAPSG